jgi:hypothetical protein
MAATHDVGSFYWTTIKYLSKPSILVERAESQEIDLPFRRGVGVAFRVPFSTFGIVFGKWVSAAPSESHALSYAIGGRVVTDDELDWDHVRFGVGDDYEVA